MNDEALDVMVSNAMGLFPNAGGLATKITEKIIIQLNEFVPGHKTLIVHYRTLKEPVQREWRW